MCLVATCCGLQWKSVRLTIEHLPSPQSGSYALLVRRNAADSSISIHGFVDSHVFVDMPDRSDYTRADLPSLDGTCLRPLLVSPLLHEMRGHAHEASAYHAGSFPFLGQTATPHAHASPPPREGHLPRSSMLGSLACSHGTDRGPEGVTEVEGDHAPMYASHQKRL